MTADVEAVDRLLAMYRITVESPHWKDDDGTTLPWLMLMPRDLPPLIVSADTVAAWVGAVADYVANGGVLIGFAAASDAQGQRIDPSLLDHAHDAPMPDLIVGCVARDDGDWLLATQPYDKVGGETLWGEVDYPPTVAGSVPGLMMLLRQIAWGYNEEDDQ